MDPHDTATRVPDPDAVEFIRFCYGRRRVGWPELYDEMCGVAARGLFRGLVADDLAAFGIGFSLYDMPALAVMTAGVVSQEQARRRPMTVVIAADPPTGPADTEARDAEPRDVEPNEVEPEVEVDQRSTSPTRYVVVPVGA